MSGHDRPEQAVTFKRNGWSRWRGIRNCSGGGVNTYTDDFGNTSGTVGERSYNTYQDDFGNTSGSIGNESINTYSDQFGNTTGTIGGDS
ncbi:MAG: hypothetical protein OSB47_11865, partial [Pirellulaceae bacterium]|nr:hypothetical protein [Pirellulaceae bacterium]